MPNTIAHIEKARKNAKMPEWRSKLHLFIPIYLAGKSYRNQQSPMRQVCLWKNPDQTD